MGSFDRIELLGRNVGLFWENVGLFWHCVYNTITQLCTHSCRTIRQLLRPMSPKEMDRTWICATYSCIHTWIYVSTRNVSFMNMWHIISHRHVSKKKKWVMFSTWRITLHSLQKGEVVHVMQLVTQYDLFFTQYELFCFWRHPKKNRLYCVTWCVTSKQNRSYMNIWHIMLHRRKQRRQNATKSRKLQVCCNVLQIVAVCLRWVARCLQWVVVDCSGFHQFCRQRWKNATTSRELQVCCIMLQKVAMCWQCVAVCLQCVWAL